MCVCVCVTIRRGGPLSHGVCSEVVDDPYDAECARSVWQQLQSGLRTETSEWTRLDM